MISTKNFRLITIVYIYKIQKISIKNLNDRIVYYSKSLSPLPSQIPLDLHHLSQTSHGPGGVLAVQGPDESSALH